METQRLIFNHISADLEIVIPIRGILADDQPILNPTPADAASQANPTDNKLVQLSIPKIFDQLMTQWEQFSIDDIGFLCNGKITPITQETLEIDLMKTRVIYVIVLSHFVYSRLNTLPLEMDEIHYKDAMEWMNSASPDELMSNSSTIHLISALKALVPATSTPPTGAAPALPAAAAGAAENRAAAAIQPLLNMLQFLQWRLVIRMIVIYFIFCHNRGVKDEKKFMIAGMMLLAYLLQTGIMALLIDRLQGLMGHNRPARNNNNNDNNNHLNNNNNNNAQGNQAQGPPHNPAMPRQHNLRALFAHGFNIPRTVGFIYDLFSIFLAFFASLFPAWEVQAEPEAPPLPPAPAAAEAHNNPNNDNINDSSNNSLENNNRNTSDDNDDNNDQNRGNNEHAPADNN